MSFSSLIPIASRKLPIFCGRGMRVVFSTFSCLFSSSSFSFLTLSSSAGQVVNIQNDGNSVHIPRCARTVASSRASLSASDLVAGLSVGTFSWGGSDEHIENGRPFFFVVLDGIFVEFDLKNCCRSMLFKYSEHCRCVALVWDNSPLFTVVRDWVGEKKLRLYWMERKENFEKKSSGRRKNP